MRARDELAGCGSEVLPYCSILLLLPHTFDLDSALFVTAKERFIPRCCEVILMDVVLGQTFI